MLTFCFAIAPADLSRQCPLSLVPASTFNGRRHPGVNVVSSRERTVPIVFRCVSVIRRDVRRIRIGLIGRRRNIALLWPPCGSAAAERYRCAKTATERDNPAGGS